MKKEVEDILNKLKKDVLTYAELRLEILKLNTYERSGKIIAILSYSIILIVLGFITTLFLFLALGFFLGELFGSQGLGFGSVAIFYIILIAIVVLNKENIQKRILSGIIYTLIASECKEDDNDDQQQDNSKTNNDEQASTDTAGATN